MDKAIFRCTAVVLAVGLVLWSPGMPLALALDAEVITQCREAIANDSTLDPAVKEIALNEVVPKLEESTKPDAAPEVKAEAKIVETTAGTLHQASEATKKALENSDTVVKATVDGLVKNGVSASEANKAGEKMKTDLAKARETLQQGGTLQDAAKYFESCQKTFTDYSGSVGKDQTLNMKDILLNSGSGGRPEDFRSMQMLGSVIDSSRNGNVTEAAMRAHFEATFHDVILQGGTEGKNGPPPEAMRGLMEQMVACGVNPMEVAQKSYESYRAANPGLETFGNPVGGPNEMFGPGPGMGNVPLDAGRFSGPSPEAIAAMSPEQKAGYEAWKSGDSAVIHEMMMNDTMRAAVEAGTPPREVLEQMARNEVMYREIISPAEVTQARVEAQQQTALDKYADGHVLCPPGKTHNEAWKAGDPPDQHCL
ncbi:MAG: hypothetical protein HY211_01330 [Candidatus Omnitrophica bacterium]|nr:hypothetical protein [Candidatus Omnitrophota bacterium]